MIRAIGVPAPGAFDKLQPVEVEVPAPASGQIIVRVVAAAVNPADNKVLRGELAGRVLHAFTRPLVTGYDFSGVVEACGPDVDDLKPGDEVFGFLPYSSRTRGGAFAERLVANRAAVARKPAAITHEIAAAAATPGITALQAMRDKGRLRAGGRLLVIGAAGGVGSLAVAVARAWLGTDVHIAAICSTYAVDFVRGLGADDVIDRKVTDPRTVPGPFDVIFDTSAAYGYREMRHQLAPGGAYVTTLPTLGWLGGKVLAAASRKRCHMFIVTPRADDFEKLAAFIAAGMPVPIDTRYPVRELGKALDQLARGQVRGRIAIDVAAGW
ncbi:MAG TPA: NAD(P)-dependent alcohol dehydrogenase [Kofleriaceae bacterium]|nr:NAD(P)-dependent alcohol dehydrogenase [Kofleriaceae bacterium]